MKVQTFLTACVTNLFSDAGHIWYYRSNASWKEKATQLLKFLTFL